LAQSIDEIKMCSRQLSAERCREELTERLRIRIFQLETNEVHPFFGGGEENNPHKSVWANRVSEVEDGVIEAGNQAVEKYERRPKEGVMFIGSAHFRIEVGMN